MTDSSIPRKTPKNQYFGIAPSEKHLEDWIVANGLNYMIGCTPNDGPDDPDYAYSDYLEVIEKLLGRQVRLPSGICDLIGITNFKRPAVTVFELKRGPIDSHALAQCLRYMRDIKTICEEVLYPSEGYRTFHLGGIDASAEYRALYYMPLVTGAIVGRDVADKHIVTACEASDIAVFTYDYTADGFYVFDSLSEWDLDTTKTHYEFSKGWIGDAIKAVILERCKHELQSTYENFLHQFRYLDEQAKKLGARNGG